jgi:cell division protein FtsX
MTRRTWIVLAAAGVVVVAGVVTAVLLLAPGVERGGAANPSTTAAPVEPGDCATGKNQLVVNFQGDDADDAMRRAAEQLRSDPDVAELVPYTRAANYERFKKIFADDPELLASVSPDQLPAAIWVVPARGLSTKELGERLRELPDVDEVDDDVCTSSGKVTT